MFDEEEVFYRILEGAEFDVEEMMDLPNARTEQGSWQPTGGLATSRVRRA